MTIEAKNGARTILLGLVEKFLAAEEMSEARFGREVAGDARLLKNLQAGKTIWLDTAAAVFARIDQDRPELIDAELASLIAARAQNRAFMAGKRAERAARESGA